MGRLVRDKVPDLLLAEGRKPVTQTLEEREFAIALGKKLVDCVWDFDEAVQYDRRAGRVEALANLQDIVSTSMALLGIFPEEVEEARARIFTEMGGYEGRIQLDEVLSSSDEEANQLVL